MFSSRETLVSEKLSSEFHQSFRKKSSGLYSSIARISKEETFYILRSVLPDMPFGFIIIK
jgi:hypothetical protein